ncbi:hypothetical protein [Ruminococcus sp.]|uniref:hypothetical protein n=1 Tax=Ruminococcus sp. TaxID=41978 RepID=UPI0039933420
MITISHDRYFLDKMASEIWEITGDGTVQRYNGNFSDYMEKAAPQSVESPVKKQGEKKTRSGTNLRKLRFSYQEQREYDTIDADIAALEEQIAETDAESGRCSSDYVKLQELAEKKTDLEQQLEAKMERWVYLNDLAERIAAGEMVQQ